MDVSSLILNAVANQGANTLLGGEAPEITKLQPVKGDSMPDEAFDYEEIVGNMGGPAPFYAGDMLPDNIDITIDTDYLDVEPVQGGTGGMGGFSRVARRLSSPIRNLGKKTGRQVSRTNKQVNKTTKVTKEISKSLDWATGGVGKRAGQVRANMNGVRSTRRSLANIRNQVSSHDEILAYHFGPERRNYRAVKNAAIALPGIRSSFLLGSASRKALTDSLQYLDGSYEPVVIETDEISLGGIKASGSTYDAADLDLQFTTVSENEAALSAKVDQLEEQVVELQAAVEASFTKIAAAEIAKHAEAFGTAADDDMFVQASRMVPSQYADRNEAIIEVVTKWLLGRPQAGSGLLGSLGLSAQ